MQNIYEVAKSCLGKDMSKTQGEYGCAEAMNAVFFKATGEEIGGGLSTTQMAKVLENDRRFNEIQEKDIKSGDIIIAATIGKLVGHVGEISDYIGGAKGFKIMSNRSKDSLWSEHLTLWMWKLKYDTNKGLKTRYFRYIGFQEDLKICKQELKDTRSVVNSFIFFIKNKLDNIINKNMNLGASTSKTMSLNKIDGLKILKGLGIAMGGSGLAFILSVLPSIDFGKNELLLLPLLSTLVNVGIKYLADNK